MGPVCRIVEPSEEFLKNKEVNMISKRSYLSVCYPPTCSLVRSGRGFLGGTCEDRLL